MTARARVRVTGRVQGVCYRQSTVEMAGPLGLTGWVRNLADGSVEALFEGERATVEQAIAWCHHGPPRAAVNAVAVEWLDGPAECAGFATRY
ncbi:MAG: acylphosphatase [Deltaproteobacteria bacterium]|nr:MAG: acylphosphatase [Deltaproteobacteria bacterium]